MDDSNRQQYSPILVNLDAAAKVTQAQQSIPLSGTETNEPLPSTDSTTLMTEIAKDFRNRQGKFVVNERTLICEDIGAGSMFLLYYTLDDNAVNNCTDIVVVSPKPNGTRPHNPTAIMFAK